MKTNIIIKNSEGVHNIFLNEVYYFENDLRKINVVLQNKVVSYYSKFDDLKSNLSEDFFQCHRSYIINLSSSPFSVKN